MLAGRARANGLPRPRGGESIGSVRLTRRLPVMLWPVAVAVVVVGFLLLFDGECDVTPVAVIGRSVGGSFAVCA